MPMWQPMGIVFPDVEAAVCDYLRDALEDVGEGDVYVDHKVPEKRRARMVIVRRDGGTPDGLRDRPRVSLNVWETSEETAADLAALVHALVMRCPNGNPFLWVGPQSGPTPVADPSKQSRRLIVVEIHTRGVQL